MATIRGFPVPADLSAGVAKATPLTAIASMQFIYNGTLYVPAPGDAVSGQYVQPRDSAGARLFPDVAAPAAGMAYGNLTRMLTVPMLDNGASLDPAHGTKELVALASAARTAQATSANLINYTCRGAFIILNVTAASGTGGLSARFQSVDPISGSVLSIGAAPTAVIATGITTYLVYPGATTGAIGATQSTNGIIPRTFRVLVGVGDASSYTYSVGVTLIP
jgi:hypothetical protein